MTIRDKGSLAYAPIEDEVIVNNAEPVTDANGAGTNINVPFAHTDTTSSAEIEMQQSSSYASKPGAAIDGVAVSGAYSTGVPQRYPSGPQLPARKGCCERCCEIPCPTGLCLCIVAILVHLPIIILIIAIIAIIAGVAIVISRAVGNK